MSRKLMTRKLGISLGASRSFKFPRKFVRWIQACVETVLYTVVVNGNAVPSFEGRRGLWQGDHVSPLLFVLVMDYLSRLMKRASSSLHFRFHPNCKPLGLTTLMFADDILIFRKGHEPSLRLIVAALKEFEGTAGLAASHEKSRLYVGRCSREKVLLFSRITGFPVGEFPMRYLGFLLSSRK